jgi:hypothetical protein
MAAGLTGGEGAIPARYYHPARDAPDRGVPRSSPGFRPMAAACCAARFWGDGGMTWIYDLHYCLKLGPVGHDLRLGRAGAGVAAGQRAVGLVAARRRRRRSLARQGPGGACASFMIGTSWPVWWACRSC